MNNEHKKFADAFGLDIDPLAEYEQTFNQLEDDPFRLFITDELKSDGVADGTINDYRRDWRDWKTMMDEVGRHPACPNENHVEKFIQRGKENGHSPEYLKNRIQRLNRGYKYWQRENSFPHPVDFNPYESVRSKTDWGDNKKKDHHPIPLDVLQDKIQEIKNVQDRAVVVTQLKLMLRAMELCNIKLSEINIEHSGLKEAYQELGTNPQVENRPNSVYIPPNSNHKIKGVKGRQGNKSKFPKVVPLDDETRQVLIDYLLIRPDVDKPWVFLTDGYCQMNVDTVNKPWYNAFQPEYDETERYKPVSSHFGRHFTTDYLKQEAGLAREKVQYLRGDKIGKTEGHESIDTYIHGHYSKVRDEYLDSIFKLGI